jgi:hypothetical protein
VCVRHYSCWCIIIITECISLSYLVSFFMHCNKYIWSPKTGMSWLFFFTLNCFTEQHQSLYFFKGKSESLLTVDWCCSVAMVLVDSSSIMMRLLWSNQSSWSPVSSSQNACPQLCLNEILCASPNHRESSGQFIDQWKP